MTDERRLVDLHTHTTASDGTLSPEALVHEAADAGLAGIGITDHDTINGVAAGLAAGEREGIIVVPGVEINTDFRSTEVHVLGYYIDIESPRLSEELQRLRDERFNRGKRIVERLNQLGMNISMERVQEISGGGAIGRPHVARAMVEAGYVSSVNSAFGKWLIRGTPAYVERYKLTPVQAIEIITEAGGVPILAHPGDAKCDDIIPDLVKAGLKGFEAAHTDHSSHQRKHYIKLARKYHVLATGGSDYHGPNEMKQFPVGHVTVDLDVVNALRELAPSLRG